MKAQIPAEGIMKTNDFGNSKWYKVVCSCGNDDDSIEFEVEADSIGVTVTTYNTQKLTGGPRRWRSVTILKILGYRKLIGFGKM